jgi:excisionase family DNA binding protein
MLPTPEGEAVERLAYSPAEAAKVLGLSRSRLYQLLRDGTIPSSHLGKRRFIRRQVLIDLLTEREGAA